MHGSLLIHFNSANRGREFFGSGQFLVSSLNCKQLRVTLGPQPIWRFAFARRIPSMLPTSAHANDPAYRDLPGLIGITGQFLRIQRAKCRGILVETGMVR